MNNEMTKPFVSRTFGFCIKKPGFMLGFLILASYEQYNRIFTD